MKQKYLNAYMKTAAVFADLSYCQRKQVGCILVKDDRIISIGYNGTPKGWANVCENENNETLPEVLHAESNAIAKLAKSNESGKGALVFVTADPCLQCAKLLAQLEVAHVYYAEQYKGAEGIEFLKKCGIEATHLPLLD